jgi:hypothetical protein
MLKDNKITSSTSRTGICWDSAPMESVFQALKTEDVHHRKRSLRVAIGPKQKRRQNGPRSDISTPTTRTEGFIPPIALPVARAALTSRAPMAHGTNGTL